MKSKKLWTTISSIASVIMATQLGLAPEIAETVITAIALIAGAFNLGQGVADGLSNGKTSAGAR
ncbi:hypothetical protein MNBD_NITROSPINAE04-1966 [hydrothermal vent metagenome]|uniref:Holin n=1 Tax=hydrothermal vent metagenome TaxID=652676 RepID=A0A3B1CEZ6_9ZZZZ